MTLSEALEAHFPFPISQSLPNSVVSLFSEKVGPRSLKEDGFAEKVEPWPAPTLSNTLILLKANAVDKREDSLRARDYINPHNRYSVFSFP